MRVVFDKFRNPQFQQIFSIVVLFNEFRLKYLSTILMKLGELSVYMWFVHALFFTQCVRHISTIDTCVKQCICSYPLANVFDNNYCVGAS